MGIVKLLILYDGGFYKTEGDFAVPCVGECILVGVFSMVFYRTGCVFFSDSQVLKFFGKWARKNLAIQTHKRRIVGT